MLIKSISTLGLVLFSVSALAEAPCKIMVTRTPCPGTKIREQALGPYDMKETKEKPSKATTKDACISDAEKFAKIERKGLFTKKVAVATFDGAEVKTASDSLEVTTCKPEPK